MPKSKAPKDLRAQVVAFLDQRFPNNPTAQTYFVELWEWFAASGLSGANFVADLTSDEEYKFWQMAWEMVLAKELATSDVELCPRAEEGPDFGIPFGQSTLWVEAICPTPEGIPKDYLTPLKPKEIRVFSMPHKEMLLRWTSALREKKQKLEGRLETKRSTGERRWKPGYLELGLVAKTDPYVVAINGCQLSRWAELRGISQAPFAVEMAFAVGPWAIPVSKDAQFGDAYRSIRGEVKNQNDSPVRTDTFLDDEYAGVSAVLGCAKCHTIDGRPEMVVVHNPFARNPIPPGSFGSHIEEWTAERNGDEFSIVQHKPNAETETQRK